MSQEKIDKSIEVNEQRNSPITPKLGSDVYDNAAKFNLQLATRGPAILYALSKANEHMKYPNVLTGAGGMVIGAFGFFGNQYYRSKGEDSAHTYMGMILGGVQFATGFLLLALQASEVFADTGDASKLLTVLKIAGVALVVTESTLVLMNSYLYGDGTPKAEPMTRKKYD